MDQLFLLKGKENRAEEGTVEGDTYVREFPFSFSNQVLPLSSSTSSFYSLVQTFLVHFEESSRFFQVTFRGVWDLLWRGI